MRSRFAVEYIDDVNQETCVTLEFVFVFDDTQKLIPKTDIGISEFQLLVVPVGVNFVPMEILQLNNLQKLQESYFYHKITRRIYYIYKVRLQVREVAELRRFPFDQQVS